MSQKLSESEKREKLASLMKGFDTAMLVTRTTTGQLRSRPLSIAESRGDGVVYFATATGSEKLREIAADNCVNVSMQDKHRFVSIVGNARITQDRALIASMWSESWKVWFPKGKDDPTLRLIVVDPIEAQYWDAGGLEGLKFLFETAKAFVTGTRLDTDSDENRNAKVRL